MVKLQVGDVFTSKSLANANFTHKEGTVNKKRLMVKGPKRITYSWTEKGEDGWERHRNDIIDLNGFDKSRGHAEFVVLMTGMSGGGTGHGPGDIYPDGWCVKAKRLFDNGTYDMQGEEITFYQTGCFTNMLDDVVKIREMSMSFA